MNIAKLIVLTLLAAIMLGLIATTCAAQSAPTTCPSYATWACSKPVVTRPAIKPISDYERFMPPPGYRDRFHEAERCTGIRGKNFDEIVWLRAPGKQFWIASDSAPDGRESVLGLWQQAPGRDTIVLAADWSSETSWVVRHELIHFLTQRDHDHDEKKDAALYGTRCHSMWGYIIDKDTVNAPGKTSAGSETIWETAPGRGFKPAELIK